MAINPEPFAETLGSLFRPVAERLGEGLGFKRLGALGRKFESELRPRGAVPFKQGEMPPVGGPEMAPREVPIGMDEGSILAQGGRRTRARRPVAPEVPTETPREGAPPPEWFDTQQGEPREYGIPFSGREQPQVDNAVNLGEAVAGMRSEDPAVRESIATQVGSILGQGQLYDEGYFKDFNWRDSTSEEFVNRKNFKANALNFDPSQLGTHFLTIADSMLGILPEGAQREMISQIFLAAHDNDGSIITDASVDRFQTLLRAVRSKAGDSTRGRGQMLNDAVTSILDSVQNVPGELNNMAKRLAAGDENALLEMRANLSKRMAMLLDHYRQVQLRGGSIQDARRGDFFDVGAPEAGLDFIKSLKFLGLVRPGEEIHNTKLMQLWHLLGTLAAGQASPATDASVGTMIMINMLKNRGSLGEIRISDLTGENVYGYLAKAFKVIEGGEAPQMFANKETGFAAIKEGGEKALISRTFNARALENFKTVANAMLQRARNNGEQITELEAIYRAIDWTMTEHPIDEIQSVLPKFGYNHEYGAKDLKTMFGAYALTDSKLASYYLNRAGEWGPVTKDLWVWRMLSLMLDLPMFREGRTQLTAPGKEGRVLTTIDWMNGNSQVARSLREIASQSFADVGKMLEFRRPNGQPLEPALVQQELWYALKMLFNAHGDAAGDFRTLTDGVALGLRKALVMKDPEWIKLHRERRTAEDVLWRVNNILTLGRERLNQLIGYQAEIAGKVSKERRAQIETEMEQLIGDLRTEHPSFFNERTNLKSNFEAIKAQLKEEAAAAKLGVEQTDEAKNAFFTKHVETFLSQYKGEKLEAAIKMLGLENPEVAGGKTSVQQAIKKLTGLYQMTTEGGTKINGAVELGKPDVFGFKALQEGAQALIRAADSSNASTGIHELAHVYRLWMLNAENGFTRGELMAVHKFCGVVQGKWTREAEEKFARAFERYLKEGVAPTTELEKAFKYFSEWISHVYSVFNKDPLGKKLSPEMRWVFDSVVTTKERWAAGKDLGRPLTYEEFLRSKGFESSPDFTVNEASARRNPKGKIVYRMNVNEKGTPLMSSAKVKQPLESEYTAGQFMPKPSKPNEMDVETPISTEEYE